MRKKNTGKKIIGITLGDPAGIGPEIAVKALSRAEVYEHCVPVLLGDTQVIEDALALTGKRFALRCLGPGAGAADLAGANGEPGTIDYIAPGVITRKADYTYGKLGAKAGNAAFSYIRAGIDLALAGALDAVVTCPVNKEALRLAGHNFPGHTEIFAAFTNTKNYGMLLSAAGGGTKLNVIHVTTHVSMREACDLVTEERVLKTIRLAGTALSMMGSETKKIAVAGLNAHASENGLFGNEETVSIIPAIEKARLEGLDVEGPLPPDTVFAKALGGAFDIVVAMYHDQGHIPLKLLGFKAGGSNGNFSSVRGINSTIGLPVIRTSVDHGTAFDLAGKNLANEESLLDAIFMAITMAENREK